MSSVFFATFEHPSTCLYFHRWRPSHNVEYLSYFECNTIHRTPLILSHKLIGNQSDKNRWLKTRQKEPHERPFPKNETSFEKTSTAFTPTSVVNGATLIILNGHQTRSATWSQIFLPILKSNLVVPLVC